MSHGGWSDRSLRSHHDKPRAICKYEAGPATAGRSYSITTSQASSSHRHRPGDPSTPLCDPQDFKAASDRPRSERSDGTASPSHRSPTPRRLDRNPRSLAEQQFSQVLPWGSSPYECGVACATSASSKGTCTASMTAAPASRYEPAPLAPPNALICQPTPAASQPASPSHDQFASSIAMFGESGARASTRATSAPTRRLAAAGAARSTAAQMESHIFGSPRPRRSSEARATGINARSAPSNSRDQLRSTVLPGTDYSAVEPKNPMRAPLTQARRSTTSIQAQSTSHIFGSPRYDVSAHFERVKRGPEVSTWENPRAPTSSAQAQLSTALPFSDSFTSATQASVCGPSLFDRKGKDCKLQRPPSAPTTTAEQTHSSVLPLTCHARPPPPLPPATNLIDMGYRAADHGKFHSTKSLNGPHEISADVVISMPTETKTQAVKPFAVHGALQNGQTNARQSRTDSLELTELQQMLASGVPSARGRRTCTIVKEDTGKARTKCATKPSTKATAEPLKAATITGWEVPSSSAGSAPKNSCEQYASSVLGGSRKGQVPERNSHAFRSVVKLALAGLPLDADPKQLHSEFTRLGLSVGEAKLAQNPLSGQTDGRGEIELRGVRNKAHLVEKLDEARNQSGVFCHVSRIRVVFDNLTP